MKIYILNTIQVGLDIIDLLRGHVEVAGIIGLNPAISPDPEAISGYVDMCAQARQIGIPFVGANSYSLADPTDETTLLALDIDVLIVAGWQRLVPGWLIDHCKVVVGIHGSPLGITKGRGRSPQTWTLLSGFPTFDVSLFQIRHGVDDGPVLDTARFAISACEDIRTSYLKVSYLVSQMLIRAIESERILEAGTPQQADAAEYLPQRLPEDGQIDWHRSSEEVSRFIRAQTRPYPGAFVTLGEHKLRCWSALRFDEAAVGGEPAPGTLLAVFRAGTLLIRCGQGAVLVTDYSFSGDLSEWRGRALPSDDYVAALGRIRERHYTKHPDLPLATALLR